MQLLIALLQYPGLPHRDSALTGLERRLDSPFTDTPDTRCDSPLKRTEKDAVARLFMTTDDVTMTSLMTAGTTEHGTSPRCQRGEPFAPKATPTRQLPNKDHNQSSPQEDWPWD